MMISLTALPFFVCWEALAFAASPVQAPAVAEIEAPISAPVVEEQVQLAQVELNLPTQKVEPPTGVVEDVLPAAIPVSDTPALETPVEITAPNTEAVSDPVPEILEAEVIEDIIPAEPELSSQEILAAIDARMTESKTAKGGFVQVDAIGEMTTGSFYIKRPGKVRFEYNDPAPFLIVSDGTTIAIEDRDLETVDRAPLASTPLKHFLKKNLSLANEATILDVRTYEDAHLVILEDNPQNGEEAMEGILFLKFSQDSYDLIGWTTLDGLGNETRVDLIDLEFNKKIPAKYFILEDEDDRDR